MSATDRPTTMLIAALGGEGGGVLSNWVVEAATSAGLWVQFTSVPGVAQRTGATTYYVEMMPKNGADTAPVMALLPSPGNLDVVVASELLEAGRAVQNGFVTPDRTTLVASNHRIFAMVEKTAMGDGRFDETRVRQAIAEMAKRVVLADMGRLAREAGSVINAVLLGAVAGAGVLPIPRDAFEAAIRAGGIAVEANLQGFAAGVALAEGGAEAEAAPDAAAMPGGPAGESQRRVSDDFPAATHDILRQGVSRLVDYQDAKYAALYLDRLAVLRDLDDAKQGHPLTNETGRRLAVWMAFDDLVRVAQLKTRPERFERVRREVGAAPEQPVRIAEFLKPGVEEWCSIMPSWLARPLLALAAKTGLTDRLNVGMRLRTSTVTGFLPLWLLSKLKPWRRRSSRFRDEQAMIGHWLDEVAEAARTDRGLALAVVGCARLVKGYGGTHRRGRDNFRRVLGALPAVVGRADAAARVTALCDAALADEQGAALGVALTALQPSAAVETQAAAE